ncbi:MAG: DUF1543 domain-containing protein [Mucilaginibacter polytrichastri]|nr:DUF1543 domain-containing protein [Mucilaginibacter polytrichastri]
MLLLGCNPPGWHTEQHDVFLGIAESLGALVPEIKAFWPETKRIHIDAWREVTQVDVYAVSVAERRDANPEDSGMRLFFVNLGGCQPDRFEEQHYVLLTVKNSVADATQHAKQSLFHRENFFGDANSHIDDKYGIDVDELYPIEDILPEDQRSRYQLQLSLAQHIHNDEIHLGYFKLSTLSAGPDG